jgi:NAD(P)-dependent dehydrogenase (short-subunit alcohol dehydrogenase family)
VATARDSQAVVQRFGSHPNMLAVKLDVTNESEAQQAAATAIERFGCIDILLNNAGYGLLGAVEESSGPEIERMFATNVFGLLAVTRAVLPYMRRQRSGHIINISAIAGYAAFVGWGAYSATKFAVEGITEALAQEVAPLGIRATVVEPGFFRTDFLDDQSLVQTKARIADYDTTVGAMRKFAAGANHAQPGDPAKLAKAMIALVNAPRPPLRMPFGSDTVAKIAEKNAQVGAEVAAWRSLAVSTDHDDGAA